MIDEGGGAGKPAEEQQKLCSLMILIQLTIVLLSIWHFHWFSHQQSYVEREGSEQTNVEENYDHQVPLPRHASPQQIFFQLKIISSVKFFIGIKQYFVSFAIKLKIMYFIGE